MAERIVSPGVFTREKDLSFLPQGITEIGACIIGPTLEGPAFKPTIIRNFSDFATTFGATTTDYYTPYAVQEYLAGGAGTVTVIRVVGTTGYDPGLVDLRISGSTGVWTTVAVLAPSLFDGTNTQTLAQTTLSGSWSTAVLTLSGSGIVPAVTRTISFDTGSINYIGDVLSTDPQTEKIGTENCPAYLYKNFKQHQVSMKYSQANTTASQAYAVEDLSYSTLTGETEERGLAAETPFIIGQRPAGGRGPRLFKVWTLSHGVDVNKKFQIGISNIKPASEIAGSDYGTFSLHVKSIDSVPGGTWKDSDSNVLEEFDNLSFDPDATNYFARRIGDRYVTTDSSGKLTFRGDWPNHSKYIRIGNYLGTSDETDVNKLTDAPKTAVPMGFEAVIIPVEGSVLPTGSFVTVQEKNGIFDANVPYGFDFANFDNREYVSHLPVSRLSTGNVSMSLEDMYGHASASSTDFGGAGTFSINDEKVTLAASHVNQRKFVVPFQGGFDRLDPAIKKKTGTEIATGNVMGFNITNTTSAGYTSYKLAIDAISNPDEYDINLLVTPGLDYTSHANICNYAISMVESRGDAFYVMGSGIEGQGISATTTAVQTLDTNYAAVYYPWVKIQDGNSFVWVPPTCVLPGVIAYTDKVAHEWFAPAGLNRGGLTSVVQAKTRLTHEERDLLYEGRVNPIASFPGQGVVVWGQKTLQAKPSALDRVNVRRLLIKLKKFIASASRYLVFEQNNSATRARFLNIVNPFLESVQANSGLSAFKVVMDDTNNTPDIVDRNQLVGQIYLQPTRTAEFIVLDFVVLPTGAAFPA